MRLPHGDGEIASLDRLRRLEDLVRSLGHSTSTPSAEVIQTLAQDTAHVTHEILARERRLKQRLRFLQRANENLQKELARLRNDTLTDSHLSRTVESEND